MRAEHPHGSSVLAAPPARHPRPREQHQHWVHRPQQDSTETELREAVPKCETHLSELSANPPGASSIENLPCPEISILREVTFLQVLTCLGSTETH